MTTIYFFAKHKLYSQILISKVQEHCGYFEWIDPPTCVRETEIDAKIIEKSSKLEKFVLIAHEREMVAREWKQELGRKR
jgi:hypothetical protein